jgi:hypothetical protein
VLYDIDITGDADDGSETTLRTLPTTFTARSTKPEISERTEEEQ